MSTVNEGSYRISGRFGEAYFIDPSGRRAPRKIFQATQVEVTIELATEDVMLAGNKTGKKDGAENITGTMAIQKVDSFFDNIVLDARSANLAARRAARDAGNRFSRVFSLQVWEDDPEALGSIAHQIDGVRLSSTTLGFNFSDIVTGREYSFGADDIRRLKHFEIIGNQIDPTTGLPAIAAGTPDNG